MANIIELDPAKRPQIDIKPAQKKPQCFHDYAGTILDEANRLCICKGCGISREPFEVLLYWIKHRDRRWQANQEWDARQEAKRLRRIEKRRLEREALR